MTGNEAGDGTGLGELRGEGWHRLLAAARRRLERTGGHLDGGIGLTAPNDAERRVVIGITGVHRSADVKRLTVQLADLDAALHDRHGSGLLATLGALDGHPVRDRPAERAQEQRRIEDARATAASSPLTGSPWFADWLAGLTTDGTLTRLARRDELHRLDQAVRILERLTGPGQGPATAIPLPVLAEWTTGDTKALVPGSPLATLVLRALAGRVGMTAVPQDRAGRRTLWESAGAVGDDLASQVLLLNVRCAGNGVVSGWLNDAADFGIPFRLTLQQQATDPVVPAARDLYICENPAVLRVAAAELAGNCPPLVCTEGMPSAACQRLLAGAVARGARLHWRADFDWSGLRITADGITRHGALPWRMGAADYLAALAEGESTPLTGPPATSPWDPALAQDLAVEGRAVMEERLLGVLLDDLRQSGRS